MKIDALRVEVVPFTHTGTVFGDSGMLELRISVEPYPGEPITLIRIIPKDDFVSNFDLIWEMAKISIKNALMKEETNSLSKTLELNLRGANDSVEILGEALDKIANDHATQAKFAAKCDWHGLFNWAQDLAKKALEEPES